jgi:hypothetical protein
VHSLLGLAASDPSQDAHLLSYLRHWRKYFAFDRWLATQADLADRVLSLRYEDLLAQPQQSAETLCRFLNLDQPETMLDPARYRDYVSGGIWTGNSSFGQGLDGIEPQRAHAWQDDLQPEIRSLCDFVCGPEMPLLGYTPQSHQLSSAAVNYLARSADQPVSWRSDLGDLSADLGQELLRHWLVETSDDLMLANNPTPSNPMAAPAQDLISHALIQSCFLFDEVYGEIRQAAAATGA